MAVPLPLALAMARGMRRCLAVSRDDTLRRLAIRSSVLVAAGGEDLPAGHVSQPDTVFDAQLWETTVRAEMAPVVEATVTDAASRSAVGYAFDVENPRMAAAVEGHVNAIASWGESFRSTVSDTITRGMHEGLSNDAMAAALQDKGPLSDARAMSIARTESTAAATAGTLEGWRASNEPDGTPVVATKTWLAASDDRVRPDHAEADGQEVGIDEDFEVGGESCQYPGDPSLSPEQRVNCFPAGTTVGHAAAVGGYRRWHDGEMVTVSTPGGVLTGTPNHPVLTERGWVPLGQIHQGDYLPSCGEARQGSSDHVEAGPTLIEQVVDALRKPGRAHRVSGGAMDFHGDGGHGEVDVVRADGELRLGGYTEKLQQFEQLPLALANLVRRPLSGPSPSRTALGRVELTSTGDVGRSRQTLALVGVGARHADEHGLTPTPGGNASLAEAPQNDLPAHAKAVGGSEHGLPPGITLEKVLNVKLVPFHGWVFNLETTTGWYTGGADRARYFVSNCRCTLLSGDGSEISAEDAEGMDPEEMAALLDGEPDGGLSGDPADASQLLDEAGTDLSGSDGSDLSATDGETFDTSDLASADDVLAKWDDNLVDFTRGSRAEDWFAENLTGPLFENEGNMSWLPGTEDPRYLDAATGERSPLWSYKGSSHGVNEYCRTGSLDVSTLGGDPQVMVKGLDDMFQSGLWKTKTDAVLWRGAPEGFDAQVGQVVEDKGFVSTSNRQSVAARFASGEKPTLVQVFVPEGTPALSGGGEGEALLNRSSRFEILARDDSVSPSIVKARLLP